MVEEYEFTYAMQVDGQAGDVSDKVKTGTMVGFKCIKGDYYGAYEEMRKAYEDLEKYLELNDMELKSDPLEFYITNPMSEADTAKWLTHIVYPIS